MNRQKDIQEITLLHIIGKFMYEHLIIRLIILFIFVLLFIASFNYLGSFIYFKFLFFAILVLATNMFLKQQTQDYYNANFAIFGILTNFSYKPNFKKINFIAKKKEIGCTKYKFKTNIPESDLIKDIEKFERMFKKKVEIKYDKGRLYIKTYN